MWGGFLPAVRGREDRQERRKIVPAASFGDTSTTGFVQGKDRSKKAAPDVDRPTLLMVGSGDPLDAALKVALDRHGIFVEAVGIANLRRSVHLTAPDLVLLVGDAAAHGGLAALRLLAEDASGSAIPVVLLAEDARLESRLHAFRHGAVAVVPRSASADAVARKIVALSQELSEHFEEKTGEIGEATFDELVDLVKKELRSGILSVHAPKNKGGPMRLVLGAGRPVAEAVQEFVARLRPLVSAADPMYYQFHTSSGGAVELLDMESASGNLEVLKRLRVLLIDDDPARADTLAQELRARGALVFVTDTAGRGLERAVGLDPQVAIVDAAGLEGAGFEVVRNMRKDLRLRWASILVAPWDEVWPKRSPAPDMEKLATQIEPLLAPERDLAERAQKPETFDVRLESTGPSRMLHILVATNKTLHVTIRNPKAVVEVDLAEGLLVGAAARTANGENVEGPLALATLLALGSGRVHVERRANPSVANVMTPVDEALSMASRERSPVAASSPPAALGDKRYEAKAPNAPSVPMDLDYSDDPDTHVKDLAGLAIASEALLRNPAAETVRPKEMPVDPKFAVPNAVPPELPPPRRPRSLSPLAVHAIRPSAPAPGSVDDKDTFVSPPPKNALLPPPSLPAQEVVDLDVQPMPPSMPPSPQAAAPEIPRPAPVPAAPVPAVARPRRRSLARMFATLSVALAAVVLIAVLGLIGYRESGLHQPQLDAVLALLGAEASDPQVPTVGEPAVEQRVDTERSRPQAPTAEVQPPSETAEVPSEAAEMPSAPAELAEETTPDEATNEAPEEATPGEVPSTPGETATEEDSASADELVARAERSAAPEIAERFYRRALELDPRQHHAMVGLGRIAMARGAPADAVRHLRGAVEKRPRRAAYRILLGDALQAAGDAAAARHEWERALELEPNNRQARQRLGGQ